MPNHSLHRFSTQAHTAWASLSTELIGRCRSAMGELARAPASECWLAALLRHRPVSEELYRDPDHDFLLLAHAEAGGTFRAPHDHGRSWVMYAVQSGEMAHRTYGRVVDALGQVRLVLRETCTMKPGEVRAYLPGDIHDTLCLSDQALYYRFTSRDLKQDERAGHQITRYAERCGVWREAAG